MWILAPTAEAARLSAQRLLGRPVPVVLDRPATPEDAAAWLALCRRDLAVRPTGKFVARPPTP